MWEISCGIAQTLNYGMGIVHSIIYDLCIGLLCEVSLDILSEHFTIIIGMC